MIRYDLIFQPINLNRFRTIQLKFDSNDSLTLKYFILIILLSTTYLARVTIKTIHNNICYKLQLI